MVDTVDLVDYDVDMKTTMTVCEKIMPAKASAVREVSAAVEPRLRETMKVILATMQGFHGAPRQEILAAAKKAGYTPAEVNAALNVFLTNTVSLADASLATPAIVENLSVTDEPKAFDPHEAGQRLVEELQAAEGGAWTGQELQARFNLTSAVLHRRRKEHRIIYWRDARHEFHYPVWQFTPTGALLPGIQEVLALFKSLDEWRVMRYFLSLRAQLSDQRPLDLLRQENVGKVLEHAKIHAEENTW